MQVQSDNGTYFKGKDISDYCQSHCIEWLYHIPYYPQAAGLVERMNGLLKEKLRKLGNNSYGQWKDNLFLALQQLNNRPIGDGMTPLSRMLTSNVQIRKVFTFQELQRWKMHEDAIMPFKGTAGSAGYDLHCISEIVLHPRLIIKCRIGIGIKIPQGYYGQIASRSSLALKGAQVMGGVIDSDYRGEIQVIFTNLGQESLQFLKGTHIAQLVIIPCACPKGWSEVNTPPSMTTRMGGFRSTNFVPGTKVWYKNPSGGPPVQAEIIAQGKDNATWVSIPGRENPIVAPTNHLFFRN